MEIFIGISLIDMINLSLTIIIAYSTSYTLLESIKFHNYQMKAKIAIECFETTQRSKQAIDNSDIISIIEAYKKHCKTSGFPCENKFLRMEIINIGKVYIIDYEIFILVKIKPGEKLGRNLIASQKCKLTYQSKRILKPEERELVTICDISGFPEADFVCKVKYTDTKGKRYNGYIGQKKWEIRNAI